MWDVIWTDPDKELVGEHRAKKSDPRTKKPDSRSGRTSVSTTATTNSSRSSLEVPLSRFRTGRGIKRLNLNGAAAGPNGGHTASSISSGIDSPSVSSMRSPLSRSTFDDLSSRLSSHRASTSLSESRDSPSSGKKADSACNISPSPSNNESIFSILPDISPEHTPMTESERIQSIIQLLELSDPIAALAEPSRYPDEPHQSRKDEHRKTSSEPLTPPLSPSHLTLKSPWRTKLDLALVTPLKSPSRIAAPRWYVPAMPNSPASSKTSNGDGTIAQAAKSEAGQGDTVMTPSFPDLREEVVRMASTDAKDMASRLYELWKRTRSKDIRHLLGGSEDVLEMRRWMLSAMNHLDHQTSFKKKSLDAQSPTAARMVLVLYETPITVTYLAALHPSKQFYDMSNSTSALSKSYDTFDNIRHIPISSISPADFPVAPRIFEDVYTQSLPSLCASAALPGILRAAHRSLKVGGALLLTLIDPLPRAGTMGPRMRAWIETHLLRNLAQQVRCMSPSTVFPRLLGEVGLRGKGSTLTTTKFYALPRSATRRNATTDIAEEEEDASVDMRKSRAESEVKAQVRSLVGRMLWADVWGPHVTAEKWWWEDEACVQECFSLGTFWEYHSIRAVKAS